MNTKPMSKEEWMLIIQKMNQKSPLTWEECDRLLDHISDLKQAVQEMRDEWWEPDAVDAIAETVLDLK